MEQRVLERKGTAQLKQRRECRFQIPEMRDGGRSGRFVQRSGRASLMRVPVRFCRGTDAPSGVGPCRPNTDSDLPRSLSQAHDVGPFTTQSIMSHALMPLTSKQEQHQQRHQLVYSIIFWCKIIRNYHLSGSTEVQIKRYTQPQADDDPSEQSPPHSSYSNTLYICCLPARQTLLTPYTTSNTAAPARLRKWAPVPPTRWDRRPVPPFLAAPSTCR